MLKSCSVANILLVVLMDLDKYIKQSSSRHATKYSTEKKCMQCGKPLENVGEPLYYQKFCSKNCKEMYVGRSLED